ncbi:hypothetical protein BDR06DRAFT_977478 [Suillus hirtellus]|nr:hypothetical protein BDR06DRAFT_977478 [Suillus hirtellus]
MWNLWNVQQAQAGSEIQPSCCTCRMSVQHPEKIKAHIKTDNTSHMAVPRPPHTNRGKCPVTTPIPKNMFTVEEVPIIVSIVELPESHDLLNNAEDVDVMPRDTLGMFQSLTAAAAHNHTISLIILIGSSSYLCPALIHLRGYDRDEEGGMYQYSVLSSHYPSITPPTLQLSLPLPPPPLLPSLASGGRPLKKSHDPAISEPNPSGSQKNHIWMVIAEVIFEKDMEYKDAYTEDKYKFMVAVSNCIMQNQYKKQCAHFHQTGASINPLGAASAQNLQEQVLINFPWFDILDKLWKRNLMFALKMISFVLGVDHTANMAALTQGKGLQMVAQAPSPDPYNIIEDAESDVIDDILDEPLLAQGKGKEKALPPSCSDEPMDEDLDSNDSHTFIFQPKPPLSSTSLNDANDGELQHNNFGPSN